MPIDVVAPHPQIEGPLTLQNIAHRINRNYLVAEWVVAEKLDLEDIIVLDGGVYSIQEIALDPDRQPRGVSIGVWDIDMDDHCFDLPFGNLIARITRGGEADGEKVNITDQPST